MSDAAARERRSKQRWAVPGGAHDRLVNWTKIALPSAVGVLIAILALAPLDRSGDISFILDKKKVANAPERMRVEAARYTGTDDEGQHFTVVARRAVQPTAEVPVVDIEGITAELALAKGPLKLAANAGRYNIDTQKILVSGEVEVAGPDGFTLETRDVSVDLRARKLASAGPVNGRIALGPFSAGRMRVDLGNRSVILDGGARLKIEQGTVR
ncbi:MAG: LPS export ABC transporter periplasmic protein LptC [Sphingomicrobium sp.]